MKIQEIKWITVEGVFPIQPACNLGKAMTVLDEKGQSQPTHSVTQMSKFGQKIGFSGTESASDWTGLLVGFR